MKADMRAVAVCGHISSGKSSVVRSLSDAHGVDVVSFGRFVRQIAEMRGVALTRETLQALGQRLLGERGVEQFLRDVVELNQPATATHLFDGVRHVAIVEELRRGYDAVCLIHLEADDRLRYLRYLARTTDEARVRYDEFVRWSWHPVERGIAELAHIADVRVDASGSPSQVVDRVMRVLQAEGWA